MNDAGENRRRGSAPAARQVLRIRYWQMLLNERLKARPPRVPVHLAIGHEAVAVGIDGAMKPGDQLVLTHRNVAFHLAREKSLARILAEYEGDSAGLCQGRLGSMNLINPERGVMYTSSILANNLPVACGLAWAQKLRGTGSAVFVLTGDGAMEEGAYYESLIFARSHNLPLVIVMENNDHSLASKINERRSEIDTGQLWSSIGIPGMTLSGNRADHYENELRRVRQTAIGGTPVCVEAHVTTHCNHAGPTPGWATDPKSIDIGKGLVVEESDRDPAWVSRQVLGETEYGRLTGTAEQLCRLAEAVGDKCLAI